MLDLFFDLVLLASVILENWLSIRFVDKLVFEGDRVLSRKQKGWIWAAIGMASLLEFANKEMGIYFSIGMLGIQLFFIEVSILAVRRKKVISTTCVLIVYFSVVQTTELLVVTVISTKILRSHYMLEVYSSTSGYLRETIALAIRLAAWGVYYMIQKREVKINYPILWGMVAVLAYLDMYYFFIYAALGKNRIEIGIFTLAMGGIVLILTVLISSSLYYAQKEKSIEIGQKDMMLEKNYNNLYKFYNENKYLSHDLKNHFNILETYMRNEEYKKAYDYMAKLREPILQIEQYVHSGNRVIDMVINDKLAVIQRENIKVNLETNTIGQVEISEKDLCAVLSNLLDNAIEACRKCVNQEAWIDISLKKVTHGLIFKISNSMCEEAIVREGRYLTTKEDKDKHGVGLESVNYILKKYNTNIKIEDTNNVFTASIVFFCRNGGYIKKIIYKPHTNQNEMFFMRKI